MGRRREKTKVRKKQKAAGTKAARVQQQAEALAKKTPVKT